MRNSKVPPASSILFQSVFNRERGEFRLTKNLQYAFQNFSSDDDIDNINEFFKVSFLYVHRCGGAYVVASTLQNKDISRYNMSLQQALDEVHASTAWLKVRGLMSSGWPC